MSDEISFYDALALLTTDDSEHEDVPDNISNVLLQEATDSDDSNCEHTLPIKRRRFISAQSDNSIDNTTCIADTDISESENECDRTLVLQKTNTSEDIHLHPSGLTVEQRQQACRAQEELQKGYDNKSMSKEFENIKRSHNIYTLIDQHVIADVKQFISDECSEQLSIKSLAELTQFFNDYMKPGTACADVDGMSYVTDLPTSYTPHVANIIHGKVVVFLGGAGTGKTFLTACMDSLSNNLTVAAKSNEAAAVIGADMAKNALPGSQTNPMVGGKTLCKLCKIYFGNEEVRRLLKQIAKNKELLDSYKGFIDDKSKTWFEHTKVVMAAIRPLFVMCAKNFITDFIPNCKKWRMHFEPELEDTDCIQAHPYFVPEECMLECAQEVLSCLTVDDRYTLSQNVTKIKSFNDYEMYLYGTCTSSSVPHPFLNKQVVDIEEAGTEEPYKMQLLCSLKKFVQILYGSPLARYHDVHIPSGSGTQSKPIEFPHSWLTEVTVCPRVSDPSVTKVWESMFNRRKVAIVGADPLGDMHSAMHLTYEHSLPPTSICHMPLKMNEVHARTAADPSMYRAAVRVFKKHVHCAAYDRKQHDIGIAKIIVCDFMQVSSLLCVTDSKAMVDTQLTHVPRDHLSTLTEQEATKNCLFMWASKRKLYENPKWIVGPDISACSIDSFMGYIDNGLHSRAVEEEISKVSVELEGKLKSVTKQNELNTDSDMETADVGYVEEENIQYNNAGLGDTVYNVTLQGSGKEIYAKLKALHPHLTHEELLMYVRDNEHVHHNEVHAPVDEESNLEADADEQVLRKKYIVGRAKDLMSAKEHLQHIMFSPDIAVKLGDGKSTAAAYHNTTKVSSHTAPVKPYPQYDIVVEYSDPVYKYIPSSVKGKTRSLDMGKLKKSVIQHRTSRVLYRTFGRERSFVEGAHVMMGCTTTHVTPRGVSGTLMEILKSSELFIANGLQIFLCCINAIVICDFIQHRTAHAHDTCMDTEREEEARGFNTYCIEDRYRSIMAGWVDECRKTKESGVQQLAFVPYKTQMALQDIINLIADKHVAYATDVKHTLDIEEVDKEIYAMYIFELQKYITLTYCMQLKVYADHTHHLCRYMYTNPAECPTSHFQTTNTRWEETKQKANSPNFTCAMMNYEKKKWFPEMYMKSLMVVMVNNILLAVTENNVNHLKWSTVFCPPAKKNQVTNPTVGILCRDMSVQKKYMRHGKFNMQGADQMNLCRPFRANHVNYASNIVLKTAHNVLRFSTHSRYTCVRAADGRVSRRIMSDKEKHLADLKLKLHKDLDKDVYLVTMQPMISMQTHTVAILQGKNMDRKMVVNLNAVDRSDVLVVTSRQTRVGDLVVTCVDESPATNICLGDVTPETIKRLKHFKKLGTDRLPYTQLR